MSKRSCVKEKQVFSNWAISPSPILTKNSNEDFSPVSFLLIEDNEDEEDDSHHLMIPRLWDIPLTTKSKRLINDTKISSSNEDIKIEEELQFPLIDKQNSSFGWSSRNKNYFNKSFINWYFKIIVLFLYYELIFA